MLVDLGILGPKIIEWEFFTTYIDTNLHHPLKSPILQHERTVVVVSPANPSNETTYFVFNNRNCNTNVDCNLCEHIWSAYLAQCNGSCHGSVTICLLRRYSRSNLTLVLRKSDFLNSVADLKLYLRSNTFGHMLHGSSWWNKSKVNYSEKWV